MSTVNIVLVWFVVSVCIITGANRGVGLKATEKYAAAGYEVIMACRDETRAQEAISIIKKANPDAKLTFMKVWPQDILCTPHMCFI